MVAETCGVEMKVEAVPFEDRRDYSASCARLEATGEWTPAYCVGVQESCAEIRDLLLSGALRDPRDPQYYNANALRGGKNV